MRTIALLFIACLIQTVIRVNAVAQDSITDYDGNVYHTVAIGTQVWLNENLKSLHYSDGTTIPGVVSYNNSDSLAATYGRLYPWNAAMRNSTAPGTQGVCPDNWHIPTNQEWNLMDNFLGGSLTAGGKLKEAGYDHWLFPNTGATNSSGFTGLPGGEYDANQSMSFQFLGTAAVFWTSSQSTTVMAMERYLSHDDAKSGSLAWYKTMKYSIRCIRDGNVGLRKEPGPDPVIIRITNPFSDKLILQSGNSFLVRVIIYSLAGRQVIDKLLDGGVEQIIDTGDLPGGAYILKVYSDPFTNRTFRGGNLTETVLKCFKSE